MSDSIARSLRLVCGHDSRSVDGCLNCEAADAIESLSRSAAPEAEEYTLRTILAGKSLYVMGREHVDDKRKPLYEIAFGMVMDDKVIFSEKHANYIDDGSLRQVPEGGWWATRTLAQRLEEHIRMLRVEGSIPPNGHTFGQEAAAAKCRELADTLERDLASPPAPPTSGEACADTVLCAGRLKALQRGLALARKWSNGTAVHGDFSDYVKRMAEELRRALSSQDGDYTEDTPAQAGAYPEGSDREVLNYLMQQFDAESWECRRCGHSEDCATMDSAIYLREYLAKHPAQAGAELPGLPEPVSSTYTMEPIVPGSTVKHHATIHVPLPAGTKLYTADQMRAYAELARRGGS